MDTTVSPISVAELEDTGTFTKSKLTANGPPPYVDDVRPASNQEKESLTTDAVVQRFVGPDKKGLASSRSPDDQTVDTQYLPGVSDSKEVVHPKESSTIIASPTASSLNSASRLAAARRPSRSYREYSFWHTAPWRPTHNVITDPENNARLFVQVSEFTRGKQDVSIHDVTVNPHAASKGDKITVDEGKGSPVVGFAQFPHGTNDLIRLGLGDPNQISSVKWIDMKRVGAGEDWALAVPTNAAEPKVFHFRSSQTRNLTSEHEASTAATVQRQDSGGPPVVGTFHFTDDSLNATLAVYSENKLSKTWKKRGKLRMYDREGVQLEMTIEELEILIVLCCAATNEKRRRKTWKKWASMGVA